MEPPREQKRRSGGVGEGGGGGGKRFEAYTLVYMLRERIGMLRISLDAPISFSPRVRIGGGGRRRTGEGGILIGKGLVYVRAKRFLKNFETKPRLAPVRSDSLIMCSLWHPYMCVLIYVYILGVFFFVGCQGLVRTN